MATIGSTVAFFFVRRTFKRSETTLGADGAFRQGFAAYYADAGTMLRDQGKFMDDSRKQQAEIDAKKQTLTDAKQKLDDLQEQARKTGIGVE